MLLQFTVGNYRSFRERVTFSLVAEPREIGHENSLTPITSDPNGPKALSLAAIYGANASGKSNLLRAIEFLRRLVVEGTRPHESIPVDRFLLNGRTEIEPSYFEIHFFWLGEVFSYGLECDVSTIKREWLRVGMNDVLLFNRSTNGEGTIVETSEELIKRSQIAPDRLRFISEGTRPNQPYLTQAVGQNVVFLRSLLSWFREKLFIVTPDFDDEYALMIMDSGQASVAGLGEFLRTADTGIEGVQLVSEDFDPVLLPDDLRRYVEQSFSNEEQKRSKGYSILFLNGKHVTLTWDKERGKIVRLQLRATHVGTGRQPIAVNWSLESDGTKRMAELWQLIFMRRDNGVTLLIDEIEHSLHPELMRFLIEKWRENPPVNSQLIFTTHNDNFLEDDLLRRDEVWFVEKDREGGSRLVSEVEYKPVPGVTRQRAYLDGMYGGTPRIASRHFYWGNRGKG